MCYNRYKFLLNLYFQKVYLVNRAEEIAQQQKRLRTYRQTLAHYLNQCAMLGAAHVPPGHVHDIRDARKSIARIKQTLRSWGVAVEDHPDDVEEQEPLSIEPEISRQPLSEEKILDKESTPITTSEYQEPQQTENDGGNEADIEPLVSLSYQLPEPLQPGNCQLELRSRPGIKIDISHQQILNHLMQGTETKPELQLRNFILPKSEGKFDLKIGQFMAELFSEEATELCYKVDEFCGLYKRTLRDNDDILEGWNYKIVQAFTDEQGLLLFSVKDWLWEIMLEFSQEFDYEKGKTEWHVFHRQGSWIRVGRGIENHAVIYPKALLNDFMLCTGYIDLIYVIPDWLRDSYERQDTASWKTSLGEFGIWTARYTKNWLKNRMIPQVVKYYKCEKDYISAEPVEDFSQKAPNDIALIRKPGELIPFLREVQTWLSSFYCTSYIDARIVQSYYRAFTQLAQRVEKSSIDINYLIGNLSAVEWRNNRPTRKKWEYEDILEVLWFQVDKVEKSQLEDGFCADLISRSFICIFEEKNIRFSQHELNAAKKALLEIYQIAWFEQRYIHLF